MGFYILDSHEVGARSKLAMLKAIPGAEEYKGPGWPDVAVEVGRGRYPIIWIDNGNFEACAIAYDSRELYRQRNGLAGRPYKIFTVPIEELVKLKPQLTEWLRGERNWRE